VSRAGYRPDVKCGVKISGIAEQFTYSVAAKSYWTK